MRKNPKAILLPRSSHRVRDLLVARPEGYWLLELGVVKHGPIQQYIKVCLGISQQSNPVEDKICQGATYFYAVKEKHI